MWRRAFALVALVLLCSWAVASADAVFGDFEFDSADEAVERCQEWRLLLQAYDRGAQVVPHRPWSLAQHGSPYVPVNTGRSSLQL